jgi:hypothetical protein
MKPDDINERLIVALLRALAVFGPLLVIGQLVRL